MIGRGACSGSINRYYYEMSFSRAAEPWIQHWHDLAAELEPAEDKRETRWLQSLIDRVLAGALDTSFTLLRWDELAHTLRERLGRSSSWRRSERQKIEQLLASGEYAGVQEAALLSASAQLDVMEGSVDDAVEALARTPFERTSAYIYGYAEAALAADRLDDAEQWLRFLRSRLAGCRNASVLRPFLKLCREADVRMPGTPLWMELMRGFLPYAYAELSAHYASRGRYADWADLQLAMGIRPDDLDAHDLRDAAKAAPGLMIPLFHQGVIDAVETRGRQGYRTAVRLLKRLEKLYEAAGRAGVWQRYLAEFQARYARLRALREEMKRGKLMP